MIRWSLIFFGFSLVSAAFGFSGISALAAGMAQFLFFTFMMLAVAGLVLGIMIGRRFSPN